MLQGADADYRRIGLPDTSKIIESENSPINSGYFELVAWQAGEELHRYGRTRIVGAEFRRIAFR